ncbi:MAG: acyl-CoA dehydrogenase, partial [Deltaproteobacteria bacterium]|nr:acyl-CoA dehydrogenase [Deltaproteobacteria bacterium]
AVAYARLRVQFGKPIAANQGIQWMLADMALQVEASRLLVYNAARLKDQHLDYSMQAAMAKLHAAQTVMDVTTKAVQIHGGIGYTKAHPVERYMRDAKIVGIYEGTNEIQRMVIAKHVLL